MPFFSWLDQRLAKLRKAPEPSTLSALTHTVWALWNKYGFDRKCALTLLFQEQTIRRVLQTGETSFQDCFPISIAPPPPLHTYLHHLPPAEHPKIPWVLKKKPCEYPSYCAANHHKERALGLSVFSLLRTLSAHFAAFTATLSAASSSVALWSCAPPRVSQRGESVTSHQTHQTPLSRRSAQTVTHSQKYGSHKMGGKHTLSISETIAKRGERGIDRERETKKWKELREKQRWSERHGEQ